MYERWTTLLQYLAPLGLARRVPFKGLRKRQFAKNSRLSEAELVETLHKPFTTNRTQFTPRELSIRCVASLRANGGTTYSLCLGTFQQLPRSKCSWHHMLQTWYGPISSLNTNTVLVQARFCAKHTTEHSRAASQAGTPRRLLNPLRLLLHTDQMPATSHSGAAIQIKLLFCRFQHL